VGSHSQERKHDPSTLSKPSALYDADGDGKLSKVEEICKKYDM
jgi:hypothetical protein